MSHSRELLKETEEQPETPMGSLRGHESGRKQATRGEESIRLRTAKGLRETMTKETQQQPQGGGGRGSCQEQGQVPGDPITATHGGEG